MIRADEIVEISRAEWPQLRDMYKSRLPEVIGYYVSDTYIRWFEKDSKIENLKVFCLNGDYSDGTFVAVDINHVYVDTLNSSDQRLIRLLCLLDYSKRRQIECVRPELNSAVRLVIQLKNLNLDQENTGTAILYHLPAEKILKFDFKVPDDIVLRSLNNDDIECINKILPYNFDGLVACLKRLAKYNQNVGAFTNDGELVAWVLRCPAGPLWSLHTTGPHRRKGYGQLITKFILKQIASLGHDGYAEIGEKNTVSRALFERLGFKPVGRTSWYGINPINE